MRVSPGIIIYTMAVLGALLFFHSTTALAALLIIAPLLGGLVLAKSPTSKFSQSSRAARRLIRERLLQAPQRSTPEVVKEWAIAPGQVKSAQALLDALDKTLEIPFGNIAPTTRLGDVFRVKLDELPEISLEDRYKAKLPESVEVFGSDILYVVERQSPKAWWSSRYRALNPSPKDEDQWIDAIMDMSAKQLVEFFAMPDAG